MMLPFKERFLAFLGRMLSVTLGIVITFTVQGILNRRSDRHSVRAALELVRTELSSNLEDVDVMADYLQQEKKSAQYLYDHKKTLAKCPQDSVLFHTGMVNAYVSLALSHDALELLKMSSLFPKIGDNDLSMKIIHAYDSGELMVSNVNRHISDRNAQGDKAADWLVRQVDPSIFTDPSDIELAVEAIDAFLSKTK